MKKYTILLILLLGIAAYGMGLPEQGTEVETSFTQIIIKVEPGTIIMPQGSYKAPIDEIEINSEGLKELNKEFNLISIELVFARKKPLEDIEEKVEEVDLENTYLLKFPELIDPKVIISKYSELEEVIYAEENKVLDIY